MISYVFLLAVVTVIYYVSYTMKKKYSYWKTRNVNGPRPIPFVGNHGKTFIFLQHFGDLYAEIYRNYPNDKLVGIYEGFKPALLIRDLDLIKNILIKDFHMFSDKGLLQVEVNPFEDLFFSDGETWKVLRHTFSPMFTSGKLKNMFPLIEQCGDQFVKYINHLVENGMEHETRELATKYTGAVIGSCAFGVDTDSFTDKKNIYHETAEKMTKHSTFELFTMSILYLFPFFQRFMPATQKMIDIYTFFDHLINNVIVEREGKPKTRKDFMDLMIELKEEGKVSSKKISQESKASVIEVTNHTIVANARLFYQAGMDTSSATFSFVLHELALNPDIQERLYKEISAVYENNGGKISYDAIKDMTYLQMVLDETLRKYPGPLIFRRCLENYPVPEIDVVIEKGTAILISPPAIHFDERYYPNPEKFDPERFSPENKRKIPICANLAFSQGPRNCIGLHFAKLQSSAGLAAVIKNFKILPTEKTYKKIEWDAQGLLVVKGGLWVNFEKR